MDGLGCSNIDASLVWDLRRPTPKGRGAGKQWTEKARLAGRFQPKTAHRLSFAMVFPLIP